MTSAIERAAAAAVGPDDLPKGGIIGSVTMRHCYPIMVHAVFGEPNVMGIPDEPERALYGRWIELWDSL